MIIGIDVQSLSLSDFQQLLSQKSGVSPNRQELLVGFPPQPLHTAQPESSLSGLGLVNGDIITVRELPRQLDEQVHVMSQMSEDEQLARAIAASLGQDIEAPKPQPTTATTSLSGSGSLGHHLLPDGRAIARRIVADDNSCLFSAVSYVMLGDRSHASSLRTLVADTVLANPFEYNEAVLGKDPVEYAQWIQDPNRWGGAIELSILSKQFGKEIAAFDIQTRRIDLYNEGLYPERVMVIYDGLHYDALAVAAGEGAPESADVTTVPSIGPLTEAAMKAASAVVAQYHQLRQFTDVANFTLRCADCKIGLKGEKEAIQHAKSTGHGNFVEY